MLKKTLIRMYEKEYKAKDFEKLEEIKKELSKYNVTTVFGIDTIYFINCYNDNVLYCFDL